MNDQLDLLDSSIRTALTRIVAHAPEPGDQPERQREVADDEPSHRWAFAAAAAVVGVGVAGVVALNRDDGPTTTGDTTIAPEPAPVHCGDELPVTVDVPGATAQPGPGFMVEPQEGQLVVHWTQGGAVNVEVRWPADPRIVYDLGNRFNPEPSGGVSSGSHLGPDTIQFSDGNLPPEADGSTGVLATISLASSAADLPEACDVVQVRYIAYGSGTHTRGIRLSDITGESIDLNPMIVSSEPAAAAPVDEAVNDCNGQGRELDERVGRVVASPAEALLDAVTRPSPDGGSHGESGYRELVIDDDTYAYARYLGPNLVTVVTVERVEGGWAVTRVIAPVC